MKSSRPMDRSPVSLRTHLDSAVFVGAEDIVATNCQQRPDRCRPGSVLVIGVDDREFDLADLELAKSKGAVGIVSESLLPCSLPQCLIPDARIAFASLAIRLAGDPCEELLTIGVMGSHGKTTLSLLIAAMLKRIGGRVAYRTTLGCNNGLRNEARPSKVTSSLALAKWLESAVENQVPASVVEITDPMLMNRTTSGMEFDVVVIPSFRVCNRLSHLEVRGVETAMLRTCEQLKRHGLVIYNADDARLNQWVEKHQLPAIGYGMDADAEIRGSRLTREPGFQSIMVSAGNSLMPVNTSLLGDHNARHVLGAVATGYAFGLELHEVIGGVERMVKIPGRMQCIQKGQPFGLYVDSADQADRLAVALHAMSSHSPAKICCVAEVPDGLDASGRAAFGRVLERAASKVILTQSRHTRNAGQGWMWEVLDGCERPAKVDLVPNRAAAIELAIRAAQPGEQILLAGWGTNSWTAGEDRTVRTDESTAIEALAKREEQSSAAASSFSVFQ